MRKACNGTVGIIAGSWGNWVVSQEPKMAEMLLRFR